MRTWLDGLSPWRYTFFWLALGVLAYLFFLLAIFSLSGCGYSERQANWANGACAEHRGVQEIDDRVVVCKDGTVMPE